MTAPAPRAERLAWLAIPLVLIGMLVLFLSVGSLGERRAELRRIDVSEVLAAADPAAVYGSSQLQVVGWYANLADDCQPDPDQPRDASWLDRTCPLHLLLAEQPAAGATQAALASIGLRLAAPTGEPFPPRAQPNGWHLLLEQLVVTGRFDGNTFVVTDTDGLVH
ncbi:MAG: hypothetical protein ACRDE9_02810 [Candidatus Limnocylindria bacterium]